MTQFRNLVKYNDKHFDGTFFFSEDFFRIIIKLVLDKLDKVLDNVNSSIKKMFEYSVILD